MYAYLHPAVSGLATYIGEDGVPRCGLQGETVTVHPDHIEGFDALNGAPPEGTAPKRRRRPTTA